MQATSIWRAPVCLKVGHRRNNQTSVMIPTEVVRSVDFFVLLLVLAVENQAISDAVWEKQSDLIVKKRRNGRNR